MKLFRSRLFLFLACLAGALVIVGSAVADELPAGLKQKVVTITKKTNRFAGEARKGLNPEHAEVDRMVGRIEVKRPKRKKGQRLLDPASYRFNGRTLVYGASGQKVTMNELITPCKARVYYYAKGRQTSILYRIDMIGSYKNSSKRWSSDHKED